MAEVKVLRSKNLQESSIAIDSEAVETVVSEADKIAARLAARIKTTKTPRQQKKNKNKNPVPEQVNNEKISETYDKPDDSNDITDEGMKLHLQLLAILLQIISGVKRVLEQNKEIYKAIHENKAHGSQWVHFYTGRIGPLCREVIKSRQCDKAKDVWAAMFDIFGEQNLSCINTSAKADDIQLFKNSNKTKEAFKCLFETDDDNILPYIEAIKKKA
ncbi:hypothetical protein RhiirC2_798233 [Rhizophagus irregularis]|uniref:Uncharacterized protein n=1 Tax=Rhizophagus irregularis TaxID=588596 RepID=A0A2N1M6T5_9GLOM|nr:hypothetical protein RhiirC2_798233 [Rhizophagus irregularis]